MSIRFMPLPTGDVSALRSGGRDANGQVPEVHVAEGRGFPCRHCLGEIADGERYLVLAYRPFPAPQPYAEVGPIFLHAEPCMRYAAGETPPILTTSERYLIRGYGVDDRIVYGSGRVVPRAVLPDEAEGLFKDDRIAYVHVRSASNNCYQCRIDRA